MIFPKSRFQVGAVLFFGLCIMTTIWKSLGRTDGQLIYALDDPYIHLSVAETILNGGYGVNLGEYASPSSSILYPFLLAGMLAMGFGDWGPLLLNVVASCAAVWMIAGVFWSSVAEPKFKASVIGAHLCLPPLLLALNLVALPMTGMEHTLHVLASVAVIVGMRDLDRGQAPSALLLSGILLAPLLRFEGLALASAALLALLIARRFKAFAFLSLTLVAVFGAYIALMTKLGLPILPSSVLVKSMVSEAAVNGDLVAVIKEITQRVVSAILAREGTILALALVLLILSIPSADRASRVPWFTIGVTAAAVTAHLAVGRYGWFGRYEVYVLAIAVVALLIVFADVLRVQAKWAFFRYAGLFLLFAFLSAPYAKVLYYTPSESQSTYAQQYQMRRFAVDFFPYPVAVNDLGYVSYRNDTHVLDLGGLGSEEARRMNADQGRNAEAMANLANEAGSVYAMIYKSWFENAIPAEWCHIATLRTPDAWFVDTDVAYYLIDRTYSNKMEAALASFETTLPPVSSLDIHGCPM